MIKLTKKLSTTTFFVSQIFILLVSLIFLSLLHYVVNVQYVKSNKYSLRGPVTTAPSILILEVTNPDDNLIIFDSPYLITGKASPKTVVLISSETEDMVVSAKTDGSFSINFPLTEGPNKITITAFNQKGEERSLERLVYYSKKTFITARYSTPLRSQIA